jgi:hypothetical protein
MRRMRSEDWGEGVRRLDIDGRSDIHSENRRTRSIGSSSLREQAACSVQQKRDHESGGLDMETGGLGWGSSRFTSSQATDRSFAVSRQK